MTNKQSKAWSDALKRVARLIQEHYGLNYNLTQQETVHAIGKLSVKKMEGKADAGEKELLAQIGGGRMKPTRRHARKISFSNSSSRVARVILLFSLSFFACFREATSAHAARSPMNAASIMSGVNARTAAKTAEQITTIDQKSPLEVLDKILLGGCWVLLSALVIVSVGFIRDQIGYIRARRAQRRQSKRNTQIP